MTYEEIKKVIKQQYAILPEEIRQALSSAKNTEAVDKIANESRFDEYQTEALEIETSIVLLGLDHPSKFIKNIQNELRIPYDLAKEAAEKINIQVFRPIREALKGIHGIEDNRQPSPPTNYQLQATSSAKSSLTTIPAEFPGAENGKTNITAESILKDIETPRPKADRQPTTNDQQQRGEELGMGEESELGIMNKESGKAGEKLLEDKLTTISKLPRAEYEHIEEAPKKSPLPGKGYGSDPYREAI